MRFKSRVISGTKHGSSIGHPTANLKITSAAKKALAREGVYAVRVLFKDKEYKGALFWGQRTLFSEKEPVCEVLILDFDGDLYGKIIGIDVVQYIRKTISVKNEKELKRLIKKDIEKVKHIISKV